MSTDESPAGAWIVPLLRVGQVNELGQAFTEEALRELANCEGNLEYDEERKALVWRMSDEYLQNERGGIPGAPEQGQGQASATYRRR